MNQENNPFTSNERVELRDGLYSEILPGLWQGGTHEDEERDTAIPSEDSRPIGTDEFDVVGTFYQYAQPVKWHVFEFRYPFYDGDMSDIDTGHLMRTALSMYTDWKAGKRVLSRCQAGWNRSGLVTALILMMDGYSAEAAIDLIRRKRSRDALCNSHFEKFLRQFTPSMLNAS
jgi:hypothetical protein